MFNLAASLRLNIGMLSFTDFKICFVCQFGNKFSKVHYKALKQSPLLPNLVLIQLFDLEIFSNLELWYAFYTKTSAGDSE